MAIQVRPVTSDEVSAYEAFFLAKGCPGFCWCAAYRFKDAPRMTREQKREAMKHLIANEVPVGVLAFDGEEPVGWCSIAPRSTHEPLAKSRTMPTVDEASWTIVCLFVKRDRRGQGVPKALLTGAVKYAKASGAKVVEAYPWDTAGLSGTGPASHWGHSRMFAAAGFEREGDTRRWTRKLMR